MYHKIVGRLIKCISRDGTKITVTTGILSEFSTEYKQILILEQGTGLPIIIAISNIEKLEVLSEGNNEN